MRLRPATVTLLLLPALICLVVLLVIPTLNFMKYSVLPPGGDGLSTEYLEAYLRDRYYMSALARTFIIAASAAAITTLVSLPVAFLITQSTGKIKATLALLCLFPLLSGSVVRAIGWSAILGYGGPLSSLLVTVGVTDESVNLAHNSVSITLVLVTIVSPVMILLVQAALEDLNPEVTRASLSLGASPWYTLRKTVLPQLAPAIMAGSTLVFVLAMNSYDTPVLIGGNRVAMAVPALYQSITGNFDWATGAVLTVSLVGATLLAVVLYTWLFRRYFDAWRRSFQ